MTTLIDTSDSQIVYINSRDRTSGTDSDFTYNVNLRPGNDYDKVVMLQAAISKSFFAIQTGYNTMTLSENGKTISVSLPAGNYTRKVMAAQIATSLTAASVTLGNNWTYTVTYPKSASQVDNGYYVYEVSGATSQPAFIFGSVSENFIYLCFGFDPSSTNTFTGNTLTSTNVINLQAEDAIFIHSDCCINYNDNILQEIYANVGSISYSNIYWQNYNISAYSKKLTGNTSNEFRFYITNEDGVPLNFNGQNVQWTLLFYHEDSIISKVKAFMQYISYNVFKITGDNSTH